MTINTSVEIPGQILPPGTYWLKFPTTSLGTDTNVVKIYNSDQTKLLASVMATPSARPDWASTNTWRAGFKSQTIVVGEPGRHNL